MCKIWDLCLPGYRFDGSNPGTRVPNTVIRLDYPFRDLNYPFMEKIYTAKVKARGGRNGQVQSDDKTFTFDLRRPREMGGEGGHYLNPELLFAAGYAACFDSALARVIRNAKVQAGNTEVECEVSLLKREDGRYFISVRLSVEVPGVDHSLAEQLVHDAEQICPYANATRGNVDLVLLTK
jgi:osmotically inducible protein OsmC